MKYQRRPEIIEATQWFNLGDHPDVDKDDSGYHCDRCKSKTHGWMEYYGYVVCPGDWIVTDFRDTYPVSDEEFRDRYEQVVE